MSRSTCCLSCNFSFFFGSKVQAQAGACQNASKTNRSAHAGTQHLHEHVSRRDWGALGGSLRTKTKRTHADSIGSIGSGSIFIQHLLGVPKPRSDWTLRTGLLASLLGAFLLQYQEATFGAPGLTPRSKKLLGTRASLGTERSRRVANVALDPSGWWVTGTRRAAMRGSPVQFGCREPRWNR